MAWRIHFTAADLARTRVGASLGPLAETLTALCLLQSSWPLPPRLHGWRQQANRRLTRPMKPLLTLIPRASQAVDLWSPIGRAATIEQGIGALLTLPREKMLAELASADQCARLPGSAWAAAEPGSDGRLRLAEAAQASYRALVEPHWGQLAARGRLEQVHRGQLLAHGGVDQLLTSLQTPRLRWRPPTLEVALGVSGDTYLDGQGLCLVPSHFVGDVPFLLLDQNDPPGQPKMMFAATGGPDGGRPVWPAGDPGSARPGALAALVGPTRAVVLASVAGGTSTTELARRAGVSVATASQHATVLRDAGLITTHRHGKAVRHALTPLGAALLESSPGPGAVAPN